ncbi:hypothetical protein JJC03_03760 [Flavobacterium oreochromis]|uniref:hypothetical protein n=1 Tax=Flavobacterium oreochromis TaxID=2906078 RepID=UPI000CDAB4E0|nr:hypothetical protein [Flavobacterium oreochromis]POR30723.1 hypothetical protein BWK58_00020 [Flavobacterium columnare]QYS87093.1 hypothetical protein JJC03_03760 [Flavobacterium oreochromis]
MNAQQLQNDKLHIINWITELQDDSLVEKIKELMRSSKETFLTNEQKTAIDQAFESMQLKGTSSHNTVMEETKKRFPHLYNR